MIIYYYFSLLKQRNSCTSYTEFLKITIVFHKVAVEYVETAEQKLK